ncbi:MAG TPA: exonuclease domain-containing protein [Steroidobacteraceae bacterium]|jgi:DNA polymerase-3 subunit epsilon
MDAAERFVFVDLETTGANAAHDRVTEIGIVRIEDGQIVDTWSSLVNPGCGIPSAIQAFTGINNEMVADAPRFSQVATCVLEKLQGAVFVAHNARFDYSFLRAEFRKLGVDFSAEVLCTVKLSRRLFPELARHNLDAVIERHGLICESRHRALGDAQVLKDFWFALRREVPAAQLHEAQAHSRLVAPRLPAHLPSYWADELPDGAGAYRLYGPDDALLYIGRGNSLRSHVLTQLGARQDCVDSALAMQVRRIDWVQTSGELGAMLQEAAWFKLAQPLFNRRRKAGSDSATLRLAADGSGRVVPWRIDALERDDLAQSFGVFHSEKDAAKALNDIARARQLCLKVLGLEESTGSCFAFQVGKCRGACVGKEPPVLHRTRVQMALSSLKIKAWPFPGRIALRERGQLHVLDQWAYLGSARSDEELEALRLQREGAEFDVDVYKILLRYLSNHPAPDWHDLRSSALCA